MSVIATLTKNSVSPQLNREQQLASVGFTITLKDGVLLGEGGARQRTCAIARARRLPLGEAPTLAENLSGMLLTLGFATLIKLYITQVSYFLMARFAKPQVDE